MNNRESIGIFEFASLGEALRELPKDNNILEIIPRGTRTTAILSGTHSTLNIVNCTQKIIIEKPHDSLMNAYLSLENSNFEKTLLVGESMFVGDLFLFCNFYLSLDMKAVDFRVPRAESSSGYVILTSDKLPQTHFATSNSHLKITMIEELSEKLKEYYNIFP